jgi:predicted RNA methylase
MKLTDETYLQVFERVGKNDMQNVFTPPRLIRRMLSRVNFMSNDKVLVWYNVEFVIFLVREVGLRPENIYIYTNTQDKLILRNNGYNVIYQEDIDFDKMSKLINVKFDVVIGNPPYQKQVGPKKTEAIWPKFVDKSFEICKEGGYVSLIHPSGWRNVKGNYKDVQKLLLSKDVKYLDMYSDVDGMKIFNASINFDTYLIHNIENTSEKSVITDQSRKIFNHKINELEFIPNGMFDEIFSLVAKEGEETVEVLYSRSAYGTDKNHMSKVRTDEHIYPCVSNVTKSEDIKLLYSSINTNGHFGLPKLICGSASSGTNYFIDNDGDYGVTQFSFAIIETPENLPLIKKVMKSQIFQTIIKSIPNNSSAVNYKILSTFKKDFWRYFLDENNNVIEPNFENVERI